MEKGKKPKIMFYDIETSYTVGAVWGLFEQNVAKVLRDPYMLTFAYKFAGDKKTHVLALPDFSLYKKDKKNDRELIKKLWDLFNEADIIVAHNGNSFDQKWAYARFIANGLKPPAEAKYVDTKIVAKNRFRFNSNSLDNLSKYFGLGGKLDTDIDLWVDCIEHDDPKAWDKMKRYNKMDVDLLEKVYYKMLPYIKNHPNLNIYGNTTHSCPNCGSSNVHKRGMAVVGRTGKVQRYQCQDCGAWSQGDKKLK